MRSLFISKSHDPEHLFVFCFFSLRMHGLLSVWSRVSAREHRGIMQSLRQLQSSRCSNQPMAVDFGFVARSFHFMASFVERKASSFLLTLKLNCKLCAACRTITFGSNGRRNIDYWSEFCDRAQVLHEPVKSLNSYVTAEKERMWRFCRICTCFVRKACMDKIFTRFFKCFAWGVSRRHVSVYIVLPTLLLTLSWARIWNETRTVAYNCST